MIRIRKSIVLPILVSASFVSSDVAANPPSIEVRTRTVSYGDLNLATPHGIATLDQRLSGAIRELCGQPSPQGLGAFRAQRRCRSQAWDGVNTQRNQAIASAQPSVQLAIRGQ